METAEETKVKSLQKYLWSIMAGFLIIGLVGGYFVGVGKLKIFNNLSINKGNPPTNQTADYSLLWDALAELNTKYVDRPLDQQKLLYGAISGLVAAAGDPYTSYFNPEEAKEFANQLKGTFDGIGAEVGTKNDQIVVVAPLDDSPAKLAGILAGDEILAIDNESTSSMTIDEAVSKIRGTAGTTVALTILHPGKKSAQEIKVVRDKIIVKSVKLEHKNLDGKKIAVIKLTQFGDDTKGLFEKAVQEILASGDQGIILDLRNDPGGYLDTAVAVASNWVDDGQTVVKEVNYQGDTKEYKASGVSRFKGIKTVVLVNSGSASASEILAGALQDYKLATLVGTKTFGKGSVQELEQLKDNSELKITIAKWLTPDGRGIHKIGLEPDVVVDYTVADAQAGTDPQMIKALELMK